MDGLTTGRVPTLVSARQEEGTWRKRKPLAFVTVIHTWELLSQNNKTTQTTVVVRTELGGLPRGLLHHGAGEEARSGLHLWEAENVGVWPQVTPAWRWEHVRADQKIR